MGGTRCPEHVGGPLPIASNIVTYAIPLLQGYRVWGGGGGIGGVAVYNFQFSEESDERETRLATEAELGPEGRQRRVMRGRPG